LPQTAQHSGDGGWTGAHIYGCISMRRYWSSLLRYCPQDSVFVGCRSTSSSNSCRAVSLRVSISQSTGILGISRPALLSTMSYLCLYNRCVPCIYVSMHWSRWPLGLGVGLLPQATEQSGDGGGTGAHIWVNPYIRLNRIYVIFQMCVYSRRVPACMCLRSMAALRRNKESQP